MDAGGFNGSQGGGSGFCANPDVVATKRSSMIETNKFIRRANRFTNLMGMMT